MIKVALNKMGKVILQRKYAYLKFYLSILHKMELLKQKLTENFMKQQAQNLNYLTTNTYIQTIQLCRFSFSVQGQHPSSVHPGLEASSGGIM